MVSLFKERNKLTLMCAHSGRLGRTPLNQVADPNISSIGIPNPISLRMPAYPGTSFGSSGLLGSTLSRQMAGARVLLSLPVGKKAVNVIQIEGEMSHHSIKPLKTRFISGRFRADVPYIVLA